ncbi:MAG: PQQ-binding-like beta-propeller repeat protein, partial [Planctomycetales bacterium]|nr:PQQ-binding-like beta-propeller repeat protein [Planctomycetales bacterium]
KALDEQRYSEAVIQLGELLAGRGEAGEAVMQDYFIGKVGEPAGTQMSLKEEALRLIGSMPPKGRELYELQFGAEARALLDQGIQNGDVDALTQVARRYFHTKAGNEASYLLGRYEMDMDHPLAAGMALQRLVDYSPESNRFEPELSVLLATCWARAGLTEKAAEVIERLRQRSGGAITIAGEKRALPSTGEEALAWLDKINGSRTEIASNSAFQWAMFRGNASRTARSNGGTPLLNSRWRLPTANDPADERVLREIADDYTKEGVAAIPSLQPLVVDGTVLMRSPRRLIGVDFRTGKRVWEWPHSNDLSLQPTDSRAVNTGNSASRRNELSQRVWEDTPYGQMSSDGRAAFFLDDLGGTAASARSVRVMPFGAFRQNMAFPNSTNSMVALDLARQGYLKWRVGGESGLDEPKLAGAFFLGAPLPLMNRLYCLAEVNAEIRLIVLDADTGRLEWSQQLAYLENRVITADQLRRLAGASPSFADGVLICPTAAGAIVAIDASTRSLRWGYVYQTSQPMINRFGGFQPHNSGSKSQEFGERWVDGTATIANGCVLITPVESDEFYCVDLLTGQAKWEPKKRGNLLFVGCVHEGNAVMIGKREVASIRLADGSSSWPDVLRLPDDDMPSGRGYHSGRYYYLPTTGSRLLKIDLESGQLVESVATDSPLGNLICYGDEVISQGPRHMKTFYQVETLRDRVAQRLAEKPRDVWALTRRGELLLQDGQYSEALASLRQAHQADSEDLGLHSAEIDSLRIRTMMAALRQDFDANRQFAEELASLVDNSSEQAEYLRLTATGYKASGDANQAFEAFLKLVELDEATNVGLDTVVEHFERTEKFVSARRDRWVQANLVELFNSAEGDARAAMEQQLTAMLDKAIASDEAVELRRFIKYFGALRLADRARFELADRLASSGSILEAELLLGQLASSSDATTAATAVVRLAQHLAANGRNSEAAAYFRQAAEQWPDVTPLEANQTVSQLVSAAPAQQTLEANRRGLSTWPDGHVGVERSNTQATRAAVNRPFSVRFEQIDGFGVSDMSVSLDYQRNLSLRNARGEQLSQLSLASSTRFSQNNAASANAYGHLLVVSTGSEIAAIDVLRAESEPNYALLWREDLTSSSVADNRAGQGISVEQKTTPWGTSRFFAMDTKRNLLGSLGPVTGGGVYFQRFREVVCVEPLTGEEIWTRGNIEPGSMLFGDSRHLFVVPNNGGQGMALSAVDGHLIREFRLDRDEVPWTANGSRLLAYRSDAKGLHLRLVDIATDNELWKITVSAGSKGDLVDNDAVAVVEPEGRIRILSLTENKTFVDHAIPAESSLDAVTVKRFVDQYIVALRRPIQYDPQVSVNEIGNKFDSAVVNGPLYAFDLATGKPAWQSPAMITQFPMFLDQPVESPVLLFGRMIRTNPQNGSRNNYVSVLAIDRRDGRVLVSEDEIPGGANFADIQVDPQQRKVTLNLQVRAFTFTFTDQPTPPAPAAKAGDLSHLLTSTPLDKLRQQAESVINNVRALPAFRRRIPVPGVPLP